MNQLKVVFKDERFPVFVTAALIFVLSWALKSYPDYTARYFVFGNMTVGFAFLSWKMRKRSRWKSVVLFFLAMLTAYQFADYGEFEYLPFWIISIFVIFIPVTLALLMNKILKKKMESGYRKAFVYFFVSFGIIVITIRFMTGELLFADIVWIPILIELVLWSIWFSISDNRSWKTMMFRLTLMLSILISWMYIIYEDWNSWLINRYLINRIILIGLPIIEFVMIRGINNQIKIERKNRSVWIMSLYFLANMLLFFFTAIHSFAWQSHISGPYISAFEICMYFVPVMLVVFWCERKYIYEDFHSLRDGFRDMLASSLYICTCAATLFATNYRIRTIAFDFGAPAVHIYDENRLDYLMYRLECLKGYFKGNTETIEKLPFLNEHDIFKLQSDSIDYIGLGTFHSGWYWLVVLVLLVVVFLIFLAKIKTEDNKKKRMMRYLIVSYVFRVLLNVFCEIFLISSTTVPFPFSGKAGMEFMLLLLFLRYIKDL